MYILRHLTIFFFFSVKNSGDTAKSSVIAIVSGEKLLLYGLTCLVEIEFFKMAMPKCDFPGQAFFTETASGSAAIFRHDRKNYHRISGTLEGNA
jgi:hypothetical protein